MFSRRHPILFFSLIFTSVVCVSFVLITAMISISVSSKEFDFGEKVGIVEIQGVIVDSIPIINDIQNFMQDDRIKAIVLRIDSPGGGAAPSQEIYREIQKAIKIKKVIASMGSVAASGGYYIASAANGIMSSPGTITGSIGVIMGYTNIEDLFKKIGLSTVVIKSGEFKDIGSPAREMTKKEEKLLQEFVKNIHDQFIEDVAEGRGLSIEKVKEIADGRILTGEQAKESGLVDRLGNIQDAIEWAGILGGIEGEFKSVYAKKPKFSFLEQLIENSIQKIISTSSKYLTTPYLYHANIIN